tara:strand:- start:460 stop:1125 length:666 start_codon:yes stop_codon:yes gene_type:complete
MTKGLVAVVPVRKGSQRVKNKNFKPFAGKNLLIHKVEMLKKISMIEEIIINSDADEAQTIAKDLNVGFKKREDYFASSECTNSDFWQNIAENTDCRYIMFTNCTSPLIKTETFKNIINTFEKFKLEKDSINTVTDLKEFLYEGNKPINFNPSKALNSQDLPNIVKLNFAVSIISKDLMFKKKSIIGDNPFLYKIDEFEGLDIDSHFEFNFAEYLFKSIQKN